MTKLSRRHLLERSAMGLAALGAGTLTLRAGAAPTESSGDLGPYGGYLKEKPPAKTAPPVAKRDFTRSMCVPRGRHDEAGNESHMNCTAVLRRDGTGSLHDGGSAAD